MNDKKEKKILTLERKEKLVINQQNYFQTSRRESLLNLTKVCVRTKINGSVNINMQKGSITMNMNADSRARTRFQV